jgi:diguanylate cyclase (GGDEF)-like protein
MDCNERPTILIIEDSKEIIKILIEVLKSHYHIVFSTDGNKGIEMAQEKKPDLILLDIMMEPLNGYQVCAELKKSPYTADIPIIFLTAVSEYMEEAKGFKVGAVDYITKPFVPMVVLARIQHHLKLAQSLKELQRLYKLALDSNPITQLPGNNSIHQHIDYLLDNHLKKHVLYIDLDNFKSYNDKYGFANGDRIIKFVAELMVGLTKEMRLVESFVGHIGGDDFVVTLDNSIAMVYIEELISRFEAKLKDFYSKEDIETGYIRMKNRMGVVVDFPVISISVVGVNLAHRDYKNYLYISDICAELKHHAKSIPGSTVLIDRRYS